MSSRSLLWYDLETFGSHPASDRIAQFACWRTDESLQPIADPVCLKVKAPWYYLPDPEACLVTGLSPQQCADGIGEHALARKLQTELGQPQTTSAGYNVIRFDDEFVRHLCWRQLLDPYAREWQHGNQRFDLLDVTRLCHALRPEGIHWPLREDGQTSFRLEHLASANGLPQHHAHDALSDVEATIALARLLRERQPRLYAWARRMADKSQVRSLLETGEPLLHVSGRYPVQLGCLRMVLPIGAHPQQRNKIAVYDLMQDPQQWSDCSIEELAEALYRKRSEDGGPAEEPIRPGLKFVHVGRCPMLAPTSVLAGADSARIGLDPERCRRHAHWLAGRPDLARRLLAVLLHEPAHAEPTPVDPELALYQGFVSNSDRERLVQLHAQRDDFDGHFDDPRLTELAWRWRHAEADPADPHWRKLLLHRFEHGYGRRRPWPDWRAELMTRLAQETDPGRRQLLQELADWGHHAAARLGLDLGQTS